MNKRGNFKESDETFEIASKTNRNRKDQIRRRPRKSARDNAIFRFFGTSVCFFRRPVIYSPVDMNGKESVTEDLKEH